MDTTRPQRKTMTRERSGKAFEESSVDSRLEIQLEKDESRRVVCGPSCTESDRV